jgi:hypothetical protein
MVHPDVAYLGAAYTRELDSRAGDGIYVRLLWHPDDGNVSVAVNDAKTGDAFELPVPAGERALDIFRHPYAYAATRRARVTKPSFTGLASRPRRTSS